MTLKGRVLLLKASFEVLTVISLQRAVLLLYKNDGNYARTEKPTGRILHSPSGRTLEEPSVIRLLHFVPKREEIRKSRSRRRVVLARDKFTCQYCGVKPGINKLTLDHIIPESKGGPTSPENLVAACKPCNNRKANRTPSQADMKLRNVIKPFNVAIDRITMMVYAEVRPDWKEYLFVDSASDNRYAASGD